MKPGKRNSSVLGIGSLRTCQPFSFINNDMTNPRLVRDTKPNPPWQQLSLVSLRTLDDNFRLIWQSPAQLPPAVYSGAPDLYRAVGNVGSNLAHLHL